jgi:hypothetical protein
VKKCSPTIIRWRANTRLWNANTQHSLSKKKFKSQPPAGKVMLWDSEGIILKQYQEWEEVIKGACITSQNWQFGVNTKDNFTDDI